MCVCCYRDMPLIHAFNAMLTLAIQDSTLVTPASGKKFGRDASDWKWWHSSVPGKLKQLYEEG
jgi:hypothetical protein